MRIVKTIVMAATLVAGGSAAFAQGRSSEADQAEGIRQSALGFTSQMQDRGLLGIRGVFLPVISGGILGDMGPGARAADDRITTQSLTNRPLPYTRPGSVNNREWLDDEAYREPLANQRGRMRR